MDNEDYWRKVHKLRIIRLATQGRGPSVDATCPKCMNSFTHRGFCDDPIHDLEVPAVLVVHGWPKDAKWQPGNPSEGY